MDWQSTISALSSIATLILTAMIWLIYKQQRDIMRKQNRDANFIVTVDILFPRRSRDISLLVSQIPDGLMCRGLEARDAGAG